MCYEQERRDDVAHGRGELGALSWPELEGHLSRLLVAESRYLGPPAKLLGTLELKEETDLGGRAVVQEEVSTERVRR